MSPEAEDLINAIIDTIPVLNEEYYRVVDNSNAACFYYPEFTGEPVTFRGQCDNSIPVVQSFDLNKVNIFMYFQFEIFGDFIIKQKILFFTQENYFHSIKANGMS